MKALNLRLLAILLVGAVIFGGAVYGIHHYQVRRNAYVFKDIADKARQEAEDAEAKEDVETAREKYEEVAENLGWYVKLVPHDIDALSPILEISPYHDGLGNWR